MDNYAHKLFYIPSGEPYKDGDGNWVNPAESTEWLPASALDADCRDQPNNQGVQTTVVDGDVVQFGSIVYCELEIPDLKRGDRVRVTQDGTERLSGEVKRFSRDFFHCRIWI